MISINSVKAPKPVGAYPHARIAGDFMFLSGVGPRKPNTTQIPGVQINEQGQVISYDVTVETESVIENVKNILAEAGYGLNHIVDVQVFLTDMKNDFAAFNKVYEKYFKDIMATRTTVQVVALPTPIHVEFKVTAYIKEEI
jgi:2-aminomuconate deaminase